MHRRPFSVMFSDWCFSQTLPVLQHMLVFIVKGGNMDRSPPAESAGKQPARQISAALYGCVFTSLTALCGGAWKVAANDLLPPRVFSPEWITEEFDVTTQEFGCPGKATNVYTWRNVGWGSNTNCELDTASYMSNDATLRLTIINQRCLAFCPWFSVPHAIYTVYDSMCIL